jgi:hypothetical protein
MALQVVPPIVVSAAAECWFYRSGEDALAAGIPAGAKVFDATGQRLEWSGADLTVVRSAHHNGDDELAEILTVWLRHADAIRESMADWSLDMLLQCAVEHAGWSDPTSGRRRKLQHWLVFVPRTLFRLGINNPRELFRVGLDLFRNR